MAKSNWFRFDLNFSLSLHTLRWPILKDEEARETIWTVVSPFSALSFFIILLFELGIIMENRLYFKLNRTKWFLRKETFYIIWWQDASIYSEFSRSQTSSFFFFFSFSPLFFFFFYLEEYKLIVLQECRPYDGRSSVTNANKSFFIKKKKQTR